MKKMSRKTKEMIGGCCVCSDERGWSENPLVYCDGQGCNVAVHQACYGIVQVPTGPWFCKKCESQERIARVKCELCPQRDGALKRTKSGGWCHVVCALYIPEACFDNVQTMEPIVLTSVPHERFNKTCYICEEQRRDTKATAGACMQCNRNGCKQYFHVTCAQAQGLLCEVTGSYENVKYCGYCSHHYKKLKNLSNVKTIPAFRPIPNDNETPDSSPEKNPPVILEDGKKKSKPDLSVETAVKSPQVDQSVSSTSDSLPPTLTPNIKTDPTLPSSSTSLSGNSSEMSDNITSAVSPSQADDFKNPVSDQQVQEPSSSVVSTLAKSKQPQLADLIIQDGSATSSTENLFDVDVTSSPPPLEKAEEHPPSKKPAAKKSKMKPDNGPKKHRLGSSDKAIKSSGRKHKYNVTSTSTSSSHSSGSKDTVKKQGGGVKKTRHLSGSSTKIQSSASSSSKSSASQIHTSLPWHHDYCSSSSNNVFGGSPYFQSLSASGHVNLPSFSSSSVFLANLPKPSGNAIYGDANCQGHGDPSEGKGNMSNLIPPIKVFPNPFQDTVNKNNFPLTMEHLLEQQWDAGAQFLMEQGEHFDISSLLNCLHHYKSDIRQLEDEVRDLTSQRDHLMAINARLSVPLSMLGSSTISKTNSAWTSLEDISSPDEAVEKPVFAPSLRSSEASNKNNSYYVEDIVSPADKLPPSSAHSRFPFSEEMYSPPRTLMHSVLNPPHSTYAGSTAAPLSSTAPSALSSTHSSTFKSSFVPFVSVPSTTSSSSSSSMPSSNPSMPLLEPSLNNLHLSNHI